jgi:predicted outer membrane protein
MTTKTLLGMGCLLLVSACHTEPSSQLADTSYFVFDGGGRDAPLPDTNIDAYRPPPVDSGPLDDAQILGILHAIHERTIGSAQIAETRAGRPSVHVFASDLITAHQADEARLATIASDAGLTPIPNPTSEDIDTTASYDATQLSTLTGPDVDLYYIGSTYNELGTASALLMHELSAAAVTPALRTEIDAESASMFDESQAADALRGGFPEAGLDYDGGPPVDAFFDVGADS